MNDLSNLLDVANAPIFSISLQGTITSWNRHCEKLTNLSFSQVQGRTLVSLCAPESSEEILANCTDLLAGERREKFEIALNPREGSGGQVQYLLVNGSVRKDVDGLAVGLVFVGQNITETLRAIKIARQVSELHHTPESRNPKS